MNTTQPISQAPVDSEVAATLQSNPEAAHFVASLAQGASLADAVRDHFGSLIAPDAPAETQQPAPPVSAEPTPAPAAAPQAEVAMYQSQLQMPTPGDDSAPDDDDDLFLFNSVSVWD